MTARQALYDDLSTRITGPIPVTDSMQLVALGLGAAPPGAGLTMVGALNHSGGAISTSGGFFSIHGTAASDLQTSAGAITINGAAGVSITRGATVHLDIGATSNTLVAIPAGITLGTTSTGMINLPSLFKIAGSAVSANVTAANLGTLTGGGATTLHTHAYVATTRTLTTTAPLQIGGGTSADLSADRTLSILDFVASGASHARGAVPDPGASAGTTKFLREDATWQVPAGGGSDPSQLTGLGLGVAPDVSTTTLKIQSAGTSSATFAAKMTDSAAAALFHVRSDGRVSVGAATATIEGKFHVAGGTQTDGVPTLWIVGTHPSAPAALTVGCWIDITSAGSGSPNPHGMYVRLGAGYTGGSTTYGARYVNNCAGSGINAAFSAETNGTGAYAYNVAAVGGAAGGGSTYLIGGYFVCGETGPAGVTGAGGSVALVANSKSTSIPIFVGMGTTRVVSIDGFGNVVIERAGSGLSIKEGTNARMGTAVLNGTTAVTVSTTAVTANSRIFITIQTPGGTPSATPYVSARTAGTSFDIKSAVALDTSTVAWMIVEPA